MAGIIEVISSMDEGDFLNDLENELSSVMETLHERGKGDATITIKVNIKQKSDAIFVNGDITSKVPPVNRKDAFFFVADGTLTRNHPQQELLRKEAEKKRNEGGPILATINNEINGE